MTKTKMVCRRCEKFGYICPVQNKSFTCSLQKQTDEEIQRKVAEAIALIVTSQPEDNHEKCEADYYERLAE